MAVQHGHDQAESLGGAERQGRKPQTPADAVATIRTADGLDRDAGLPQDGDVPARGTVGDAEFAGQPVAGDAGVVLQQLQAPQRASGGVGFVHSDGISLGCGKMTSGMPSTVGPMTDDTPWEPPLAGTEVEHLVGALDRQRTTFRWKADGLDATGLRTRVGAPHP